MNSCVFAAVNQEILTNLGSVPALLYLSKKMISQIEDNFKKMPHDQRDRKIFKNIWNRGGTNQAEYLKRFIDKKKSIINKSEKTLIDSIESGKWKPDDVLQFLKVWNKTVQSLGSVLDPGDIVYLSKKPFENHWLASAVTMVLPSVVGTLFGNYPTPSDRIRGFQRVNISGFLDGFLKIKINKTRMNYYDLARLFKKLKSSNKDERTTRIEDFWERIFAAGGMYVDFAHHITYLRAIQTNGKRQFVLAEVKDGKYIVMNEKQFGKFVRSRNLSVG